MTKRKSRLHTYGCSFTVGLGPSWAHILAHDYDEHIQHARRGVGNLYMLKELVNTELEETDTVMIMWTYPTRQDFTQSDEYFYNNNGQQWQSETYIKAAEQICKLKGCAYRFFSYGPWYKAAPNAVGKVFTEKDDGLAPWEYGGAKYMTQGATLKLNNKVKIINFFQLYQI